MAGRPTKEYDEKTFVDLVGLGCTQEEICWFFRDESGKPANKDTLSRWCNRTFGMNFQEYYKSNGGVAAKITLRRNQLNLTKKSAAMAIFLGKNMLGQTDKTGVELNRVSAETNYTNAKTALITGEGVEIEDNDYIDSEIADYEEEAKD